MLPTESEKLRNFCFSIMERAAAREREEFIQDDAAKRQRLIEEAALRRDVDQAGNRVAKKARMDDQRRARSPGTHPFALCRALWRVHTSTPRLPANARYNRAGLRSDNDTTVQGRRRRGVDSSSLTRSMHAHSAAPLPCHCHVPSHHTTPVSRTAGPPPAAALQTAHRRTPSQSSCQIMANSRGSCPARRSRRPGPSKLRTQTTGRHFR